MKSIACFDRALSITPNHELVLMNKGGALAEWERYSEAVACFDEVLRMNPDNAECFVQ